MKTARCSPRAWAISPLPGQEAAKARARRDIIDLCRRFGVTAIAIGNGTASREAEQFIASLLPELPKSAAYMIVSEAGASVYSASKLAAEEFPAVRRVASQRGSASPAACRTPWPSWSRSTPRPSAWGSTSMI